MGVACQTSAAHNCAAAVPPNSNLGNLGGMEDDKPGIGSESADGERRNSPGNTGTFRAWGRTRLGPLMPERVTEAVGYDLKC